MRNTLNRFPLYFFISLLIFVSCDNGMEDVEVPNDFDYYVESELITMYSEAVINATITAAMLAYPDQADALETIKGYIQNGVKVYKITYKTEFQDEELNASGIVCLPDEAGSYPILSYQNGTNTLHSAAPSVDTNNTLFKILQMMGSTGFVITIPDYLGFGASDNMFHPYLHKESTVQTVMDMLRAVEEMVEKDETLELDQDIYITGYSQGGWATMALQEALENQYSSEFNLQASSWGAGPCDLTAMNEYILGLSEYPMPYFLGYIFNSYTELGMTTAIEDVVKEPYAGLIPTLYDGTNSGDEINSQLTTSITDFLTADYLSNWTSDSKFEDLNNRLEENSVEAWKTSTPTMILAGTEDDFVPPVISSNIYVDFITAGSSTDVVKMVPLAGLDHSGAIIPSGLASIKWFIELKGEVQ
ncbi:prolyl oligopeptidase family serine peptidase [Prolixibacteraceae bacterium Z1-6]|uniref:Prolyl oligopeptidase family serine peptidase n=1 Tax=Draconibacterium aestuarii TaxID=2998507 RepID=A0A9X3FAS9_9BACT|nr:prolyl oligopeptidase family serine peptidase [Prolixibacteraceae bacterium Z1-6]